MSCKLFIQCEIIHLYIFPLPLSAIFPVFSELYSLLLFFPLVNFSLPLSLCVSLSLSFSVYFSPFLSSFLSFSFRCSNCKWAEAPSEADEEESPEEKRPSSQRT